MNASDFLIVINKVIVDLEVCKCSKLIAGPDWQFLCPSHPKPLECNGMDYVYHTMDTIQCLITNPSFYPSHEYVSD
jgi:hypothetical protein